jgi:hypothetical protein
MRSPLLVASIGCFFFVACSQASSPQESRAKPGERTAVAPDPLTQPAGSTDFIVGAPVRHKNLTIFPVLSKTEQNSDRFITLDEGLHAHSVEVIEIGANRNRSPNEPAYPIPIGQTSTIQRPISQLRPNAPARNSRPNVQARNQETVFESEEASPANEVNRLMVVNRSGKPLYLMPGEVIVGGSQDRTIGEEMTIAPTGKTVPIDVYCVEHGRWAGRDETASTQIFASLAAVQTPAAAKSLAAEASKGKFVATAGSLNKSGRLAVQSGEGQQAVWDRVQRVNTASGVDSESGAFTFNYSDDKVLEKLQPYSKDLAEKIAAESRVVGAVVAINGKIESVDVFESTPLFRKLWPKLLKSYALDALNVSDTKIPAKTCNVTDATAFLEKVMKGSVSGTKQAKGGLVVTRRETKEGISYSAASGGAMGGMGGAVHSAGYAP